jgi:putative ABC transport system ATP-binding protein
MSLLIEASRLKKSFDGKVLFQDKSLRLNEGEVLKIIGPSGSGKSTFLKLMTLLVPKDEGDISYKNKLIEGNDCLEFRSKVHYLGQDPLNNNQDIMEFFLTPYTFKIFNNQSFNEKKTGELLEKLFSNNNFLKKKTSFLSGGEKQALKLIRSLLLSPEVLLLDESMSSMDDQLKIKCELLLKEFQENGGAFCMITHDAVQLRRVDGQEFFF